MADYSKLNSDELKRLADSDDKDALFETAKRCLEGDERDEARKYFTLSATLGHAKACVELGKFYDVEGIRSKAIELYLRGYELGDDDVAARLAEIMLEVDEEYALELLTGGALSGNVESMEALEKYYLSHGNDKEAKFWKSKREDA